MTPTTAFVFPGGGSQVSDPIGEFHDAWPAVDRAIERLNDPDVRELLFESDREELDALLPMHRTVFAASYAVADAVTERFDVEPDVVAGHSTGHITALPVAGAVPPSEAMAFVTERSRAMLESATERGPGKMVAVLLTDGETVEAVVDAIEGASVAAFNAPNQTVVSGRAGAVEEACELLEAEFGPVRTTELDVEIGAHSPAVAGAVDWAADAVKDLALSDSDVPIVSDVTGEPYESADVARRDLPEQIAAPVQWHSIVETLDSMGVDRVVEFPPAGVLSSLVQATAPDLQAIELTDPGVAEEVFDA